MGSIYAKIFGKKKKRHKFNSNNNNSNDDGRPTLVIPMDLRVMHYHGELPQNY